MGECVVLRLKEAPTQQPVSFNEREVTRGEAGLPLPARRRSLWGDARLKLKAQLESSHLEFKFEELKLGTFNTECITGQSIQYLYSCTSSVVHCASIQLFIVHVAFSIYTTTQLFIVGVAFCLFCSLDLLLAEHAAGQGLALVPYLA